MFRHHFFTRYGASTPGQMVTVASILGDDNTTPASINGYAYLHTALDHEFFERSESLRVAGKVFTAVIAVTIALSTFCFLFRLLFKADRSFYKLLPTPRGTFVMPNVIQTWLLANIFFGSFAVPFIWRSVLIQGGSLFSAPIWICLVWMSIFVGVWHVAWATSVTALVQSGRLGHVGQTGAPQSRLFIPPILVNLFFILGLLVGLGVYAGFSGMGLIQWNRGVGAWDKLHLALKIASNINAGKPANADDITKAIPNIDAWLATMTTAFWKFEIPWTICLALSGIAAVVQSVACIAQVSTLTSQIDALNSEIGAANRQSIGPAPSTNSSLIGNQQRKKGLVKVLYNVIFTSIALTLSMFGYIASCVVGGSVGVETRIFHRRNDLLAHLYIIAMIYPAVALVAVVLITIQTFDRTVLATKTASNNNSRSRSSGITKMPLSQGTTGASSSPPTSPNSNQLPLPSYTPMRQDSPFSYHPQEESGALSPGGTSNGGHSSRVGRESQLRSPMLPEV